MLFDQSTSGQLVSNFGYLAVLFGTMLEGETIVLVAGLLAQKGNLSVPLIALFAFMGSSISDQGLFFLARKKGNALLHKKPALEKKIQHLTDKAQTFPFGLTAFALLFRFFYGFRNIAPLVLGLSSLSTAKFVFLNMLGATIWAIIFSYGGYYIGQGIAALTETLAVVESLLISVFVIGAIGFAIYRYVRHKRNTDQE